MHRPPPVIATLAKAFAPASNTSTEAEGILRFNSMAQKHPAAPAPMIAIFIIQNYKNPRSDARGPGNTVPSTPTGGCHVVTAEWVEDILYGKMNFAI